MWRPPAAAHAWLPRPTCSAPSPWPSADTTSLSPPLHRPPLGAPWPPARTASCSQCCRRCSARPATRRCTTRHWACWRCTWPPGRTCRGSSLCGCCTTYCPSYPPTGGGAQPAQYCCWLDTAAREAGLCGKRCMPQQPCSAAHAAMTCGSRCTQPPDDSILTTPTPHRHPLQGARGATAALAVRRHRCGGPARRAGGPGGGLGAGARRGPGRAALRALRGGGLLPCRHRAYRAAAHRGPRRERGQRRGGGGHLGAGGGCRLGSSAVAAGYEGSLCCSNVVLYMVLCRAA